jgi:glycosyltransferase involved in cell wall biosynthesis
MKKIKVLMPIYKSFKVMDRYIENGGEIFSLSRYGYEVLKRNSNIELETLESKDSDAMIKILKPFFNHEANNLISQIKLILRAHRYDVIYYSSDRHPYLISIAKILGLFRTPVLMLCHFTFNTDFVRNPLKKIILKHERIIVYKSMDKILFLGEQLKYQASLAYKIPERHLNNSHWGASIEYFSSASKSLLKMPESFYFASGNAMRDYKTLIDAFRDLPFNLVISCPKKVIEDNSPLPQNIFHYDFQANGFSAFSDIKKFNQAAKAVLIPIIEKNHVANASSSFVEALACGKPIIISDTGNSFLDVEDEKIGKKVLLRNKNDWIQKIIWAENNAEELSHMSANALKIAKFKYNYELFSQTIIDNLILLSND